MINHAIQTDVRQRCLERHTQKRILKALAALANENGEVHRSIIEIAAKSQASPNTVIRALHELHELGEISILSQQRIRGHYRINRLPEDEKPRIDSLRTPIAEAIRLLPLPVRISVIFQALATYASRQGNNMFPSLKTLVRDTNYSEQIVRETMRWLLAVGFVVIDKDCINPKYQARTGYSIPAWNANAQLLAISDDQVEQIKQLYRLRHRKYHQLDNIAVPGQDESTWLEDHSLDLEESQSNNDDNAWLDEEELAEESTPATPTAHVEEEFEQDRVQEREDNPSVLFPQPERPGDRVRLLLHAHRARVAPPISLKQYDAAIAGIKPHLAILDDHHSGQAIAEPGVLKKAEAIVAFYRRTIETYEAQMIQRE